MSTRVHTLAKELEVTSKAILEKCRAEGLDVKNHMSTLSAGLEATIREWFSEGESKTAVEEAEQVDLKKVRRPARRKKKEEAQPAEESGDETATAVEEPPAEEVAAPAPEGEPEAGDDEPAEVEAVAEEVEAEAAEVEADAPAVEEEAPAIDEAAPEVEAEAEEVEEEEVKPAAKREKPRTPPQNVPKPAELRGPKVIRVERPEPDAMRSPRSRPPARSRTEEPPDVAASAGTAAPSRGGRRKDGGEEETDTKKGGKRRGRSPRRSARSEAIERVKEWRDQDLIERQERLAQATGRLRTRRSDDSHRGGPHIAERPSDVVVESPISVKDLSAAIAVKSNEIIRHLMSQGQIIGVNAILDDATAVTVADHFGVDLKVKAEAPPSEQLAEQFAAIERKNVELRPPVVTFLGHVDHGKTSLLDRIRQSDVVSTEAGGITQHIGAYRVETEGKQVVFLDTPGHEAFTHLRSRGANMTDVVVLVVAADDGVMPQTIEAINHAKAAEVPIVVALNKIDRPNANPDRVYGQLAEYGLSPREWGGSTEVVRTSATTGEGVDDLFELLNLEAEMLELKADTKMPATGTVIEAEMSLGRGVLIRALVQEGTLKVGDVVICGPSHGRVRAITNDKGQSIQKAGPAMPVEISGMDEVPEPGEKFYVLDDLKRAKELAETRRTQQRESELFRRQAVTLENLFSRISAGEVEELPLIIKADVQGSIEVLVEQLTQLSTEEVRVNILHAAVGSIAESDVLLAAASDAIIIGFHVAAEDRARGLADERGVQIRLFRVIYEITDSVRKALEGMLEPEIKEVTMGQAEVRETFKVSRLGTIAGCMVTDGVIQRNNKIRLIRDGIVVQDELSLDSLKRFKDDAREVRAGLECGIKLAGYDDLKVGDKFEAWTTEEVARTL